LACAEIIGRSPNSMDARETLRQDLAGSRWPSRPPGLSLAVAARPTYRAHEGRLRRCRGPLPPSRLQPAPSIVYCLGRNPASYTLPSRCAHGGARLTICGLAAGPMGGLPSPHLSCRAERAALFDRHLHALSGKELPTCASQVL
jgi:hypothetical protein